MTITVLGAGAWGTAMACHLARCGHRVTLTARRLEHALELAEHGENRAYLAGCRLPESLQIGCEVAPAVMEAEVVLLAAPVDGLRQWARALGEARAGAWQLRMVVALCKGLERESLAPPSVVLREWVPGVPVGVLSGPSFAAEVARGVPTAVTLACDSDAETLKTVQTALSGGSLRVYRSSDVAGVELAGALKNPYAIGAGICAGLELGDNALAAYLTRALAEMARIGVAFGGQAETFYGLSGVGDLVATATGGSSRNRSLGVAIGQGEDAQRFLENRRSVTEGYAATAAFWRRCGQANIDAAILQQLHAILYEGRDPHAALTDLMARPLKPEA